MKHNKYEDLGFELVGSQCPDDLFDQYGETVSDWISSALKRHDDYGVLLASYRLHRYQIARAYFCELDFSDDLRLEPRVLENYIPSHDEPFGTVSRMFMFKVNNNGTTYRINDMAAGSILDLNLRETIPLLLDKENLFMAMGAVERIRVERGEYISEGDAFKEIFKESGNKLTRGNM